jgi:hypothetical protein
MIDDDDEIMKGGCTSLGNTVGCVCVDPTNSFAAV